MQETLEIDDFIDIGVEVSLLLDALIDLLEERLIDELLNAAHGEVGHEILPITEVAKTVESIEDVLLKVIERLRLVFHAEPEHPRRVVAAKDACAVEVHLERLVVFSHLLTGLNDLRDVLIGRIANELQGQVDLIGFAPIDVSAFVLQVMLETLHQSGIFAPDGNGDG